MPPNLVAPAKGLGTGAAGRAGGALAGQSATLEKGTLVQRRRTDRARTRSAAEGQRKKVAVANNLVTVPNNQGCDAAARVSADTAEVKKLDPEAAAAAIGGTKPGKVGGKATVAGWFQVKLLGLDVFDPATMETDHRPGDDVPCRLLDTDCNGLCFHVCQAFFPRTAAWDDLKRALKGEYDDSVWEHLTGTTSAPFQPGEHGQVAVKVIDDRGNELMVVEALREVER